MLIGEAGLDYDAWMVSPLESVAQATYHFLQLHKHSSRAVAAACYPYKENQIRAPFGLVPIKSNLAGEGSDKELFLPTPAAKMRASRT